jgi:hypothetical protein
MTNGCDFSSVASALERLRDRIRGKTRVRAVLWSTARSCSQTLLVEFLKSTQWNLCSPAPETEPLHALMRLWGDYGRTIASDRQGYWLAPAIAKTFRVLEGDNFCVSSYGWQAADRFVSAWRVAGSSWSNVEPAEDRYVAVHSQNMQNGMLQRQAPASADRRIENSDLRSF